MVNVFYNIPSSMRPFVRSGLPVTATKTYELRAPVRSHFRKATCKEIDCPAYLYGWATTVLAGSDDESTVLKAASGVVDGLRRYWTRQPEAGGFVRYVFLAGQACFAASSHVVTLEREPLYVVRGGDWRADTGLIRQHTAGEFWVEDFAENQGRLATHIERG
jgi:hypothetical protein